MKKHRTVLAFEDYTTDFLDTLSKKVQDKFIWTFELIEDIEKVPKTYFKHIEDGIYEVRVKQGSNIYRIFAFFDDDKLVLTANGFTKKTQRTPRNQIVKAKKIRAEYEKENK